MNTIDSHLTLEDANPANKTDLKGQLRHLDSIRALAALCVVVYHAYSETANSLPQNLPHGLTWFFDRLLFGTAYVDIFIVLSGFCLTISLARSNTQTMLGGNLKYFLRRARRILPPYFAAYILSSLLLLIIPAIDHLPGKYSGGELQPFSPIVIITHLLLIHNLYPNWQISSNVALWSVATEWQIYFIMPAFLLPLRNRYGLGILILGAFGLGLLLTVSGTYGARFWFIGLFALGMSAAYILYDASKIKVIKASKLIGCAFYLIAFLIHLKSPEAKTLDTIVIEDACIGFGTAAFLIHTTHNALTSHYSRLLNFLNTPWLTKTGSFSYSIYLCHFPVIVAMHYLTFTLGLKSIYCLLAQFFIACPMSIILAKLFHNAFEKPFMQR